MGLAALLMAGAATAAPLSTETPFTSALSQTCVSVSTSAWTAIPATTNGTRTAVNISNPSSNTVYIGASSSVGITVPGAVIPTLGNYGMQIGNVQLYAIALTAASTVCVWEVKQ